jgi:hypothetical protein
MSSSIYKDLTAREREVLCLLAAGVYSTLHAMLGCGHGSGRHFVFRLIK